jgi:tRNA(Ile)-lysidine synthase
MFLKFEHKMLALLKSKGFSDKKLLLAISGGADSMALMHVFVSLQKILNLKLSVAYIHHGWSEDNKQLDYRNQCWSFIQQNSKNLSIDFCSNLMALPKVWDKKELTSEESLRDYRKEELQKIFHNQNVDFLVYAHHHEDLLETRLLRLIRGTHLYGLGSMGFMDNNSLRPLISYPKSSILDYIKEKQIGYLEDPSNASTDPMRNWVREFWLKELEKKQKGSVAVLSRSLQNIVDDHKSKSEKINLQDYLDDNRLNVSLYMCLSPSQKLEVLAQYLRFNNSYKFTQNHLNEINKRIHDFTKPCEFDLLKQRWVLSGEFLFFI